MRGKPSTQSRRDFIHQGLIAASGIALACQHTQSAYAQSSASGRFHLSLHQYSLNSLFANEKMSLNEYAPFVKKNFGITNIEFGEEFCGSLFDSLSRADEIRKISEDAGVTNRILLCTDGNALDSPSRDDRAVAIKHHVKVAAVAERLGCDHIRVRASGEGDKQQQLSHAAEGISGLCDALENKPVSVLIENIAGFSRDPDWLVSLVNKIGPQRVGLIADFGNFDGDIYEGMAQLLPHTRSVCTKAWEFDQQGNETKIDYQRMMKVITDSEFRGCIAIEYLGETPISGIKASAELVKRYW